MTRSRSKSRARKRADILQNNNGSNNTPKKGKEKVRERARDDYRQRDYAVIPTSGERPRSRSASPAYIKTENPYSHQRRTHRDEHNMRRSRDHHMGGYRDIKKEPTFSPPRALIEDDVEMQGTDGNDSSRHHHNNGVAVYRTAPTGPANAVGPPFAMPPPPSRLPGNRTIPAPTPIAMPVGEEIRPTDTRQRFDHRDRRQDMNEPAGPHSHFGRSENTGHHGTQRNAYDYNFGQFRNKPVTCFNCGKPGHKKYQCPDRMLGNPHPVQMRPGQPPLRPPQKSDLEVDNSLSGSMSPMTLHGAVQSLSENGACENGGTAATASATPKTSTPAQAPGSSAASRQARPKAGGAERAGLKVQPKVAEKDRAHAAKSGLARTGTSTQLGTGTSPETPIILDTPSSQANANNPAPVAHAIRRSSFGVPKIMVTADSNDSNDSQLLQEQDESTTDDGDAWLENPKFRSLSQKQNFEERRELVLSKCAQFRPPMFEQELKKIPDYKAALFRNYPATVNFWKLLEPKLHLWRQTHPPGYIPPPKTTNPNPNPRNASNNNLGGPRLVPNAQASTMYQPIARRAQLLGFNSPLSVDGKNILDTLVSTFNQLESVGVGAASVLYLAVCALVKNIGPSLQWSTVNDVRKHLAVNDPIIEMFKPEHKITCSQCSQANPFQSLNAHCLNKHNIQSGRLADLFEVRGKSEMFTELTTAKQLLWREFGAVKE